MNMDTLGINETVIQEALQGVLEGWWEPQESALMDCRVRTFEEAGLLLRNKGLVITLPDDTEYQLTIVRSR